jgi:hypothetical protein
METLFSVSNLLVMPFWILMIFLPRWQGTRRLVASPLIVAAPAMLYILLLLPRIGEIGPVILRPMLDQIVRLLGTPEGATIVWLHFLAFDLFVGRWIYLDSREREVNLYLMGPILFLTLMFGPMGLLTYLVVRSVAARQSHEDHKENKKGKFEMGKKIQETVNALAEVDRPLAIVALACLLVLPIAGMGILLDPRQITGVPAWLKPAKFLLSTGIYALTLLWMLRFVQGHRRLVRGIARVTAVALAIEIMIIVVQAARGLTSHFNVGTPLDAALWSAMAFFIVLAWIANFLAAVLLLRSRIADRAFAWSLRLGILLTFAGMGVGFFMTAPTPTQLSQARTAPMRVVGAHTVGASDGSPGMPVTNWSTRGGDLRIPHFVGLHALQVLPLLGWLLSRRKQHLGEGHRVALVWTAGLTYLVVLVLLTWQALRGQPLLAPDTQTLTAIGILFVAAGLAFSAILLHARKQAERLLIAPA